MYSHFNVVQIILVTGFLFVRQIETSKRLLKKHSGILKLAIIEQARYAELDETKTRLVGGQHYTIMKFLTDNANLGYEIVHPIERFYGTQDKMGRWNGVVGRLQRKDVDMGFCLMFITRERLEVVDFTVPIKFFSIRFILHKPARISSWTLLIEPFTMEVWVFIFATTVVTGCILYFVLKLEFRLGLNNEIWSLGEIFWFLCVTFTLQSGRLERANQSSSRLIIGTWYIMVLVVVWSYSGTLTASMSRPTYEHIPRTFRELAEAVKKGEYSCGVLKHSALVPFFMNAKDGSAKLLGDNMRAHPENILRESDAIKLVLKKKFAFIGTEGMYMLPLKEEGREKFFESQDMFATYSLAYPIVKGSTHKKKVNKILTTLFETGIIAYIEKQLLGMSLLKSNDDDRFKPLKIEDILSSLLLLCMGYLASVVFLVLEIVVSRVKNSIC